MRGIFRSYETQRNFKMKIQTNMKKGPDLVMVIVLAFVVGSVLTGVFSQTDFQFASLVGQVFNRQG